MSITEAKHRNRLGRFILYSNLGFAGLVILYYLLAGFDTDEFLELMKLLAPIKAAYLTAFIRYVIANRNTIEGTEDNPDKPLNPLFATTSYIIITVHIASLVIATSLYALVNAMEFEVLKKCNYCRRNFLWGICWAFYGGYV